MKIIENLQALPKTAGDAELIVRPKRDDSYHSSHIAEREKEKIFLDQNESMRFYSLLGGQQFLFTADGQEARHLYFGGTDERPFLVELELSALEGLITGEKSFFEFLKPAIIRRFEKGWETKAERQGDFLAVAPKKHNDWGEFMRNYLGKNQATMSIANKVQLKNTRHHFQGLYACVGNIIIGEGIIVAPDHEPLVLDGPHIIEQAAHLLRPEKAD